VLGAALHQWLAAVLAAPGAPQAARTADAAGRASGQDGLRVTGSTRGEWSVLTRSGWTKNLVHGNSPGSMAGGILS
jgi:hypothetical protein